MRTYVAFLRGVNLGPARRVQMAALRGVLARHGHENVATYLQSGNVVLDSPLTAAELERELEAQLAGAFGFDVDVLVRSASQLRKIVESSPLSDVATDPARYLVTFLRAKPPRALVDRLAAADVEPERMVAVGRELYSWHPGGVGRSELAKLLQPKSLGVAASARNWRVVEQLSERATGPR